MKALLSCLLLVAGGGCLQGALAAPHHVPPEKVVLAPGYSALTFKAPAPGTYDLPVLGLAANGSVVNDRGEQLVLADLFGDKSVLLSFIYTNCDDVNGCPLATFVLSKVQDAAIKGGLDSELRLVSISFDPTNDSPEVLHQYAGRFRKAGFDWQFLTAPDEGDLASILSAYDQFIINDRDSTGKTIGSISHILRVYLIDRNRQIRNIYSVSFLHPDIIINDVKTMTNENINDPPGASSDP